MMTCVRRVLLYGALSLPFGACAWAQDEEELEVDHALTFEFETPHTDWASPYARGKTRVLFFTNGRGTVPRECVEVMQRFDIEAEAVFWARIVDSPRAHWHGGKAGERRMLKLLEKKWDCFVFHRLNMAKMSPEQQYKVLRPVVEGGAGVVLVGSDDKRILKKQRRIKEVPAFLAALRHAQDGDTELVEGVADRAVGEAFTVGRGRGIRLPRGPDIGYHEGWEVEYDYWSERLGRAILWAAGKEPASRLQLTLPKEVSRGGEPVKLTASVTTLRSSSLRSTSAGTLFGANPRLRVRLRRPADRPVDLGPHTGDLSEPVTMAIPVLPAGSYHADAWVVTDRGIETWATRAFTVTSPRKIAENTLTQDWGEVGDPIAGSISLEGPPLPDETLEVRLMDRRRRILVRQALPVNDNAARFSLQALEWMPMLVTVEARLLQGDEEISRAYRYFRLTKRHHGRFNFLIWDKPRGALAPYAERSLVENGVTLQLGQGNPPLICAAYDCAWVPYTTRILARQDARGIMKPFCWNDEAAVRKHVEEKAKAYTGARQHGVFVWSLGDEVDTRGSCLSEHCRRAYREYLRAQYGTLSALNASWGTDFIGWEHVGLSKEGDNEEANALKEKNYPRWFDRQAFRSWNFVQFCGKYAAAYKAIDPEAKTGFEGAGRFDKGDDIDLIVRHNAFWAPYPGTADEVLRSIAPREFPRANWMGYTKDAETLLRKYWRMVTRGCDSVWWWRWDCIGRFHGWIAPDLRPYPAVKDILQDTRIVRDGLGDLLLRSTMLDDGIAIVYSYPSSLIHRVGSGGSYGGYESAHKGAHALVRELGLQFRYVTDRMLKRGALLGDRQADGFKVLMLVRVEALGREEADLIRRFATEGGLVIADVRPGIYDDHCKPRAHGVLDDLFGVRRTGTAKSKEVKHDLFGTVKLDPSVTVTTGRADMDFDGVPAFITNTVGRGRAVLYNFDMGSFRNLGAPAAPEEAAEAARAMFRRAGVAPAIRLTNEQGLRERNVETIRWQDGDIEIVAFFRQAGKQTEVTVSLDRRCYVYDLRNRTTLGTQTSFRATIIPDRASFFALAPRAQRQARLRLDPKRAGRGSVVSASVAVPRADGLHALRVRVSAGDEPLEWLNRNVIAGRDPVTIDLPIAYNDPVGPYTVRMIDLFSDRATSVRLQVR